MSLLNLSSLLLHSLGRGLCSDILGLSAAAAVVGSSLLLMAALLLLLMAALLSIMPIGTLAALPPLHCKLQNQADPKPPETEGRPNTDRT